MAKTVLAVRWLVAALGGDGKSVMATACDSVACPAEPSACSPAPSEVLVFVTQATYTGGQIGGLAGGDAKCTQEAGAAGLTGNFAAWLSDSTTSAASRLTHATVPYVMADGTQVADDGTDFTDGTHDAQLTKDANGVVVSPLGVWTGTTAAGEIANVDATCSNWTSDAASGVDGYVGGQPH